MVIARTSNETSLSDTALSFAAPVRRLTSVYVAKQRGGGRHSRFNDKSELPHWTNLDTATRYPPDDVLPQGSNVYAIRRTDIGFCSLNAFRNILNTMYSKNKHVINYKLYHRRRSILFP
jgi:hypothetical protein